LLIRFALVSLCACSFLAAADHVVLKNGDSLTGTVIKKDGDKLTLKSEFLGEVTIPWSAVKSLQSDQELNVVLPGGQSVKGKVSTSGDTLAVSTPAGDRTAALTEVTAVRNDAEEHEWERLQHPGFFQLWNGTYNFGLALARGNARTATLTNAFVANRTTLKDKVIVHFNEIYATALVNGVNAATASELDGGWEYNRNFDHNWFISTTNDYDHDRFQALDLRAVFGAGAGWKAVTGKRATLSFQGGADYERENFMAGIDRNSAELSAGDTFTYKLNGSTNVSQTFFLYPNLSETGAYRFILNVSAVTAIRKWLGWHITFTDTYLSNPVLGRLPNDLILSTGFQLAFAQK
jgi:putative salt-induced outer membrane protein YdiY